MVAEYKACSFKKNARKGIVSKSEKAYRSVYQSLYYVSANCSDRRIYIDTFIGIDISKSQFDNFISIQDVYKRQAFVPGVKKARRQLS